MPILNSLNGNWRMILTLYGFTAKSYGRTFTHADMNALDELDPHKKIIIEKKKS